MTAPTHQQHLLNQYQDIAQKLLEGTITPQAFAQQQVQIHLQLEILSYSDGLIPEFLNNRGFGQILDNYLKIAQRFNMPSALLALDIDKLKRFNDKFGHVEGDKLIKIYAATITSQLRASDLKGRVGGDEFTVYLIGLNLENAQVVAEKIRQSIILEVKKTFPSLSWEQTISIGIAPTLPTDTAVSLREKADQALYIAKKARNKTVIFSPKHNSAETNVKNLFAWKKWLDKTKIFTPKPLNLP